MSQSFWSGIKSDIEISEGAETIDTQKEMAKSMFWGSRSAYLWKGTHKLVQKTKDEIVATDVVDLCGRSQLTIRFPCVKTYGTTKTSVSSTWRIGWRRALTMMEKKQRQRSRNRGTLNWRLGTGLRGEMHFPVGSKPMEVFPCH